jgi:hypothetical protein
MFYLKKIVTRQWGWKQVSLLMLAVLALTSGFPAAPEVAADSPSRYSWRTEAGPRHVPNTGAILAQAGDASRGSALLLPSNADPNNVYLGQFAGKQKRLGIFDQDCYGQIAVRLNNNNSGTIVAPTGQGNYDPPCRDMPKIGSQITISGTRPQPPETPQQKKVEVFVYGNPGGRQVEVIIKSKKNGQVVGTLTPDRYQGRNDVRFGTIDLEPDTYVASCKAGLPFNCGSREFIKIRGSPQRITLGETAADQKATFRIFVDCSVVKADPPYTVTIYNDKNKPVASFTPTEGIEVSINDPVPPLATSTGCLKMFDQKQEVPGLVGGRHRACIVGRKHCYDFVKVIGDKDRIDLYFGFEGIPKDDPVCVAGMLGWLFCPLEEFMQHLVTSVAGIIEGLLYVEPLTLNASGSNPIYSVWTIIRDIANIAFIIAFLFLIFSQATSMGMSNYGIKRLLPRLLIMAVLVNVSYYLCAFAIDVANLIGVGVKGLIQTGIDAAPTPNLGEQEWDGSYAKFSVAVFGAITAMILLPPIWAFLTFAFAAITLAVLTGFVVLVVRQILIVMLVILSPLAFVAALLPNTEDWFIRWRKTFTTMLLSYPVIMFVLYGATLVAAVLGAVLTPPGPPPAGQ